MFAVPRIIYSMANDGLLLTPFSYISKNTHTPIVAIMFAGLIGGSFELIIISKCNNKNSYNKIRHIYCFI